MCRRRAAPAKRVWPETTDWLMVLRGWRPSRRPGSGLVRKVAHQFETFTELNAEPLVVRASEELPASGESARKPDPSTPLEMTPMELNVARLSSPAC